MLTKQQILDALDGLIAESERLHSTFLHDLKTWTPNFAAWLKASESTVEAIFGTTSEALRSFKSIYFLAPPWTPSKSQADKDRANLVWFDSGLRYAHATLSGFRYSVERLAPEEGGTSTAYIFLSHGGPTRCHVDATRDLIAALGLSPIVVADLPSLNMSLNEKVLFYMGVCSGAVVLATLEDETIAQEKRTRPNVENEVGALQTSPNIGNRIVYLKEDGVTFPSNYREKVWIPFQKENVEKSFIHIVREFRAFGFIP